MGVGITSVKVRFPEGHSALSGGSSPRRLVGLEVVRFPEGHSALSGGIKGQDAVAAVKAVRFPEGHSALSGENVLDVEAAIVMFDSPKGIPH